MNITTNPFITGNPVRKADFIGRLKEVRKLLSRISSSQSTALVGEPRCGKTSILMSVADHNESSPLRSEKFKKVFTQFIDIHMLGSQITQEDFWKIALSNIYESLIKNNPDYPISESYRICESNNFRTQVLENFLKSLEQNQYHLVLLLDEFDLLLSHEILNNDEFFGSLRSISSRLPSLSLVIASRQPLTILNSGCITGSPYFNFMSEITIGPMSQTAVNHLLSLGDDFFTPDEKKYVKKIAGSHPFLLQSAASILWDLYQDQEAESSEERLYLLSKRMSDTAHMMMQSTWRLWEPQTKMAMTIIAITQSADVKERFNTGELFYDIRDLRPELRTLEAQGFIKEDNDNPLGWSIRPKIFIWWITDEVIRTVRSDSTFNEWVRIQEWDGMITTGQKKSLLSIGTYVSEIFKGSSNEVIKSYLS